MRDFDVEADIAEHAQRRELAAVFHAAMRQRGYSITSLARAAGVTATQVQRLLHPGGALTLRTLARCADRLGLRLIVEVREEPVRVLP